MNTSVKDSSVGIATDYGLSRFESQTDNIFLFFMVFKPVLGPTQLPVQWVPGAISQWIKWLGLETEHSPPSSSEVKNGGAISSLPICLHGIVLNNLRDFTFFVSEQQE
jgi:hypothetical protein